MHDTRRRLPRLSRAMVIALVGGLGAAVLVAIALGDSAPWPVKIPIALIGGATIGLLGAGYAEMGRDDQDGG